MIIVAKPIYRFKNGAVGTTAIWWMNEPKMLFAPRDTEEYLYWQHQSELDWGERCYYETLESR